MLFAKKWIMKLTIVLTVYNKERYLGRAFSALLNQVDTEKDDYEVLVVNDGSTDGSAAVIDDYVRNDFRVRVLTQPNQGLSMARNNGIEPAKGDYIWFVDADDEISNYSVRKLCDAIDSSPDVIPIYACTQGINKVRNMVNPSAVTGKDILIDTHWEHCGVFWVMKKSFLLCNHLRFFPGIYHEDAEFTPRMLYTAEKVYVVPEVLYKVFHAAELSITSVPRPNRAYDMVTVVETLQAFFANKGELGTLIGRRICDNNAGLLNTALFVITQNNKEEQKRFDKVLFEKRKVLKSFIGASLFVYRVEGILLSMFPKHYSAVFSFFRRCKS